MIINGEPYSGGRGLGGEVGHMYVNGIDFEANWKNTRKEIKQTFGRNVLFKELVHMKDKSAKEILSDTADYLGKGFASCIAVLDPEIIAMGGGPSECGTKFLKMVQKKVDKYTYIPKKTQVKWTTLKEPGVLGASLLVS